MNVTDFQIRFHGPVPLSIIVAAASVYILLLYRNFLREIEFPRAYLPVALRGVALACVVIMIAGPVIYFNRSVPAGRSVAALVDTSQSMGVRGPDGETRAALALKDLRELAGAAEDAIKVYAFDETARETGGADAISGLKNYGRETLTTKALEAAGMRGTQPPTDIVLFTDGEDTSGGVVSAAGAYRIHAIVYGGPVAGKNTGVFSAGAPEYGFVDTPFRVAGKIYGRGAAADEKIGVELYEDGKRVAAGTIQAAGGERSLYGFELSYTPEAPGMKSMELRVKTADGESVTADNSRWFLADIISERRRILLVDSPLWEFKFLRRFLATQEKPVLDVVLAGPGGKTYAGQDVRKTIGDPGVLGKYRLVIAGPGSQYLSDAEKMALTGYVERGGRMVVLGGAGNLGTGTGKWERTAGRAEGTAGDDEGFEVLLTETGAEDPLMRIAAGREENIEAWKTLPFVQTFAKTRVPENAAVLATHPWMKCAGVECPVIYRVDQPGGGRVLVFAFNGLWRWSFVEKRPEYYDRLWSGILKEYMESEAREPMRIILERSAITIGEKAAVMVDAAPGVIPAGAAPFVEVTTPGGEKMRLEPVSSGGGQANTYTYEFTPDGTGIFAFDARSSETGGIKAAPARLAVNVSVPEYEGIGADVIAVRRMAEETGGTYAEAGGAGKIIDALKKNLRYEKVRKRVAPWATVYFLALVMIALTAEWILRRRGGLP